MPRLSELKIDVPNVKKVAIKTVEAITGAPLIPARCAVKTIPTIAGTGSTQSVLQATASALPISFIRSRNPGVKNPNKTTIGPVSKISLADLFFSATQDVSMQAIVMKAVGPSPKTSRITPMGSVPLSRSPGKLILAIKPMATSNFCGSEKTV